MSHKAFRASFTLVASLYIGAADAAGAGGLPLGAGASAENDHLGLSVGQAGFHTPPNGSDQYQFREFRPAGRPGFLPRPRRLLDRMVRTLLHALPRQEDRSIPLRSSCCLFFCQTFYLANSCRRKRKNSRQTHRPATTPARAMGRASRKCSCQFTGRAMSVMRTTITVRR